MRIVIAPAGSRGDFQPLLALAVGLRGAGHDVLLIASPNFEAEARAFGVPVLALGFDVEAHLREHIPEATPSRGAYELLKVGRRTVADLIDAAVPAAAGADLIVGGGAQIAAPTVAEAVGAHYAFVAYTPQLLWSAHHAPFIFSAHGLPHWLNRVLWHAFTLTARLVLGGPLNRQRRSMGLAPVADWREHFFPRASTLLCADPELAPPAPDTPLSIPPTGALHLPDERPLPPALERFLAGGPAPIYVGFGSMPDRHADATTELFGAAARAARVRLVISAGWAGFGGVAGAKTTCAALGDGVLVIGAVSHTLLFPHVAAVVHHGGSGTTSAALRAGRPQILVPHMFDQFQWSRWAHAAGVAPVPIARRRLTAATLAGAMREVTANATYRQAAAALASKVMARDPIAACDTALRAMAGGSGAASWRRGAERDVVPRADVARPSARR